MWKIVVVLHGFTICRQKCSFSPFWLELSNFYHFFTFAQIDETSLLIGDTANIPQTVPSHEIHPDLIYKQANPIVDMVREDPRDSIYKSEWFIHSTDLLRKYSPHITKGVMYFPPPSLSPNSTPDE